MKDAFFLIHSIKLAPQLNVPQELSAPVTQFSFTSFDEKSPTLYFELGMIMKLSGDKEINISVRHFTVLAGTGLLLKLAGFAVMNESVTPPSPIFKSN